jgi:hypothetical protein
VLRGLGLTSVKLTENRYPLALLTVYRYSELTIKQILLWFQVFSNILVVVSVNANLFRVVDETEMLELQHDGRSSSNIKRTLITNNRKHTAATAINSQPLTSTPISIPHLTFSGMSKFRKHISLPYLDSLPRFIYLAIDNRLSGQGVAIKKPSSRNSAS